MRLTDEHIATYQRDGFVVVENFIPRDEARAALEGFHQYFPTTGTQGSWRCFPTAHSGLNQLFMHPTLIDAAERIHGDRDLLLADGMFGVRYAGEDPRTIGGGAWHIDYANNTLGPEILDRGQMHLFPTFGIYLTDVGPGDAPIRMARHGESDAQGVDILGPAGTLWIYSLFTRHTATPFTNPVGYRAVVSTILTPRRRLYDCARLITQKSGAESACLAKVLTEASPRQLELFGFPPAGDPFWTPAYVAGMERRYPGFRGELYRRASAA